MLIDTKSIFSMTEANQNFSRVARTADEEGQVVVFKNNKAKYLVIDLERSDMDEYVGGKSTVAEVSERILGKDAKVKKRRTRK